MIKLKKNKEIKVVDTKCRLTHKELSEVEFRVFAALNKLYEQSPFYYHFLMYLPKRFDHTMKHVACIAQEKVSKRIKLIINPEMTVHYTVSDFVILLQHESLHLCYEHLADAKFKSQHTAMSFNKACDYKLNDHIPELVARYPRIKDSLTKARKEISDTFNGQFDAKINGHPDEIEKFMNTMTKEQYGEVKDKIEAIVEKYQKLEPCTFFCTKPAIDHMPEIQKLNFKETTSEELYNILFKKQDQENEANSEKNKMKIKITQGEPGDDHEPLEGEGAEPIELDQITQEEIKQAIKDAAEEALETQKNFGNMPANLTAQLYELLKSKTNYLQIIQSFAASVRDADITRTWKRRNRRYPSQVPGKVKEDKPDLCILIDTSGSMFSDRIMQLITTEIAALKQVCGSLTLVMGDTRETARIDLHDKDFDAKNFKFHGGGGTDLQFGWEAARQLKCDGLLAHSDGFIPKPDTYGIPTLFLIYPGGQEVPGYRNIKIDDC